MNIQPGEEGKSRKIGLLVAIALMPIFFLFSMFGYEDKGFIEISIIGVFILACYAKKKDILRIYNILSLIVLFIAEFIGALFVNIKIPKGFSIIIAPFAILNLALVFLALFLAEKVYVQFSKSK